ncbi:hypothetical protein J22TS1_43170 [Siminovitchia terrae]|uniref:hypothetical protein n=1 Tax=Siminovitchia terrae TaxID=1914933 RepID=UPI001B0AF255|nr:hypothetical protein [Siminovitchia terrae]GIN93266.1 hypothetical protein J22TS1_43170 [Siminovitchia terrae]
MGKLSKFSFMCIGFNLSLNFLLFLMIRIQFSGGGIFGTIYLIVLFGNIVLPVMVSLGGAMLGIGSIILKEKPLVKSMIAIVSNIIYIIAYFSVWSM